MGDLVKLEEQMRLAEHKIDQHLQGQYNYPPYRALGTALAATRAALLELNTMTSKEN